MNNSLRKSVILTITLLIALAIILIIIANGAVQNNHLTLNLFSIVIILALIALVWFKYLQEKSNEPVDTDPVASMKPIILETTQDNDIPKMEEHADMHEIAKEPLVKAEKKHQEKASEPDTSVQTRTGSNCTQAGMYTCSEHPQRSVEMQEGRKFPPCRGDGEGHSAIWVMGTNEPGADTGEDESLMTKTGAPCKESGLYVCSEHPDHTVEMEEGKRFPPCRGDGKGHSAKWLLQA